MTTVITVRGLSFEFSNGRELFKDLSFSLSAKRSALVGPNGVGKTCLAKILVGELEPSEGSVLRKTAISLFPQRQEPEAVSVEDFLAGAYIWSALGEELLDGVDREALCTTLSGGQWMRVRLARSLEDGFLILDEPTNDLDREGRRALLRFLREHEGGVLLISHDRECLRLCEDVLELSNRGLAKFGGGWDAYIEMKEREREGLSRALDLAHRERDSLLAERSDQKAKQEKRNRRGRDAAARGGMPKILLGARKSRAQATTGKVNTTTLEKADKAVSKLHDALSEIKVDPVMYADLVGQDIPAQRLIAEAQAFNIRLGDWLYQSDLAFSWRGNIRLALKGANGSGKSTLLKAVLGAAFETRGELRLGQLLTLFVDQRCALLDDTKSVIENVRDVSQASESEIRNGLARFLFTKETVFQKVSELSGGERLRAALARGLLSTTKPELLILDEPTNNLDLANVEFLEGLVREFRGALIVVSHDDVFLDHCGITEDFVIS